LISGVDTAQKPFVSGIAFDRRQVKLSILGIPKKINIAKSFDEVDFDLDMTVQNHSSSEDTTDFIFTVHLDDYEKARIFCEHIAKKSEARDIAIDDQIAKLSLVGLGMESHAGVASKIFETLGSENILIYLITSTDAKISTIIDEKHLEAGARLLHAAFDLG
jgi:aspartate kinase